MPNTYTQIYLHVVFAVSGRACVIDSARHEELQKYISGIVTRQGQKLIAVYCRPDHTHVLLGLKPKVAPSDLIGDIKTG
jgi:REP-associated tyrosine transposase